MCVLREEGLHYKLDVAGVGTEREFAFDRSPEWEKGMVVSDPLPCSNLNRTVNDK